MIEAMHVVYQNDSKAVEAQSDLFDSMAGCIDECAGIVKDARMQLDQPVHRGHWFGRMELPDGQDMIVLRRGGGRLLPKLPRVTIGWRAR